jgi:mRNA interferase MazF
VVVISSDGFNRSNIQTVIVAVVTSNLRLADAPGNIRISKRDSRLSKASVINVSQLLTLDKGYLARRVGRLSEAKLAELEHGLRMVLELGTPGV